MDTFTAIADCRKNSIRILAVIWLIASALSLLALKVAVITCLFLEVFVLLVCVFSYIHMHKNTTVWQLDFEGNTLYITNSGNNQTYKVYDVPTEDFIMTQTESQRKRDCGDLRIKDTIFMMGELQNYTAVKQYIETHF